GQRRCAPRKDRLYVYHLGVIVIPPFQMKLPDSSGREPDLIFVAQAHLGRLTRTYLDEPADLAVELVSPESLKRDREEKFAEYQRGGVSEYWILDPDLQQAEFYQLEAQGVYQRIALDAQGIYRAQAMPGFWLNVAWLWQNPLPGQDITLYEIIGKPYADYQREQMRQRGL
ncbi:MAG TPA: Uma2 family endonuclease, partial [Ktedonobacterales bacterium]|nr:Uma2 family endonuclease [Ktedonobacterales bacterium]